MLFLREYIIDSFLGLLFRNFLAMDSLSIDLFLPDFLWKSLVEVICGHHLAVRIDVSEHYLLGLSDGILVVEDKERV